MRNFAGIFLICVAAAVGAGQTPTPMPDSQASSYTRPDGSTRAKRYVNSMFGPAALARNVGNAGLGTWRNTPEEWGGRWEGFGKRVASEVGKSVIRNSTQFGLDEALALDSRFYRSTDRGTKARLKNALISPFTARRPWGKRTIGIPRIAGVYVSNVAAAEGWYPTRYTWKDGMRAGTIWLGVSAAFNLFREFVWQ